MPFWKVTLVLHKVFGSGQGQLCEMQSPVLFTFVISWCCLASDAVGASHCWVSGEQGTNSCMDCSGAQERRSREGGEGRMLWKTASAQGSVTWQFIPSLQISIPCFLSPLRNKHFHYSSFFFFSADSFYK